MLQRSDGEIEVSLGNKQLFSVLFIVVILLGLFFAMGFLAGRSTAPGTEKQVARTDSGPLRVDSGDATPPKSSEPAASTPAPAPEPQAPEPPPAQPPAETVKPTPQTAPPPKPAPSTVPAGVVETPASGRYLQVAATVLSEAQSLSGLLAKESLRTVISPSSKPEYLRVLVGPLPTNEAIADARERLKKLGINNPYIVTYK